MKVIDNRFKNSENNLKASLKSNSKMQIDTSIFSMYYFDIIKNELNRQPRSYKQEMEDLINE